MHFMIKAGLMLSAWGSAAAGYAQSKKYTVAEGIQAQVIHSQGSSTIDVLIPGAERMTLDLAQPGTGVFQIKNADYNFDGYKDFAFVGAGQGNGLQVYDLYLYNQSEGVFELLDVPDGACETFGNVRLNPADKTLRSSCTNGPRRSLDIYRWATPFSLELVRSEDNSTVAAEEEQAERKEQKEEQAERRKERREDQREQRTERRIQRAAQDEE